MIRLPPKSTLPDTPVPSSTLFRSYATVSDLIDRAAKGFQQLGVGPGVHVGLFLPNTPHYVVCFLAILKAGGRVVNYSPLDAERELRYKIEDSQTDIIDRKSTRLNSSH